jgi:hypothetical protein
MRKIIDLNAMEYGVGIRDISRALQALLVGPIQLVGTLGPPDFLPNGARSTPGSVWCADSGALTHTDVLRYDIGTGELTLGNDRQGMPLAELPCAAKF